MVFPLPTLCSIYIYLKQNKEEEKQTTKSNTRPPHKARTKQNEKETTKHRVCFMWAKQTLLCMGPEVYLICPLEKTDFFPI